MADLINMTPKERVFGTLKNVRAIIAESHPLDLNQEQLCRSLDNAISWESQLVDIDQPPPEKEATQMIKPSIGRKVWFHLNGLQRIGERLIETWDPHQALDATVVFVHSDRMVNLRVTDHKGESHAITSVQLRQEGDPVPPGMYCEWMPFQKGRAAEQDAKQPAPDQQGPHD